MKDLICKILCSSIKTLFVNQFDIFDFTHQTGETEWNLCHHLSTEISKYIFWLNHDIDLTKNYFNGKRPDIIFHKRGINALNYLAIEVKHRGASSSEDIRRIKKYWMGHPLNYRFGASVNITNLNKYKAIVFQDNEQRTFNQSSDYIPLKTPSESQQKSFIDLVDKIFSAKQKNPNADTSTLERQIDIMVYELYGLTPDEIAIVEDGGPNFKL